MKNDQKPTTYFVIFITKNKLYKYSDMICNYCTTVAPTAAYAKQSA